jgi:hypothetical protein
VLCCISKGAACAEQAIATKAITAMRNLDFIAPPGIKKESPGGRPVEAWLAARAPEAILEPKTESCVLESD